MDSQALVDLSPLARMMLMGVVVALGPLAWVGLRNAGATPARRLQALTLLTLFLTFDLVLFGAFTRLTDSGLGCPDWPGCYGNASPVGAKAAITAAQTAMPTGPVTHGKAWVEMIHRYLATGVGVLILTLAAMSWLERRRAHGALPVNPWWPTLTLFWVCVQGAFGALTVTMKLFPAIVTLHLLGGLALLALLCVQAVRFQQAAPGQGPVALAPGLRLGLWVTAALVVVQVTLGGWVSTNYAVLACSDFPTCQGSWWPAMDFSQGFTVWRTLGHTPTARPSTSRRSPPSITCTAWPPTSVLAALAVLAWRLRRAGALQRAGALDRGAGRLAVRHRPVQHRAGLAAGGRGVAHRRCRRPGGGADLGAGRQPRGRRRGARHPNSFSKASRMTAAASPASTPSVIRQFNALTKPRVIQLIVFCALIGMVLAVPGVPSWARRAAHGAGQCRASGWWPVRRPPSTAWWKRASTRKMKRTAWRPTARGELSDRQTLVFSAVLCAIGSALLYVWVNPLTMWLTFATFVGYAVIYTVILKPLTPQNIVIGGASGAMPPVLGWAAMTGDVGPEALILFLIIFLWTPPHFWALALYRVEDYRKSGLPMLPVTHGNEFTRLQVLLYTLVLFAACLMPFAYGMSSWLYLGVAVVLSVGFIVYAFVLWRNYSDALARKTFRFSLIHLSVLFAALLVDHYLF